MMGLGNLVSVCHDAVASCLVNFSIFATNRSPKAVLMAQFCQLNDTTRSPPFTAMGATTNATAGISALSTNSARSMDQGKY